MVVVAGRVAGMVVAVGPRHGSMDRMQFMIWTEKPVLHRENTVRV